MKKAAKLLSLLLTLALVLSLLSGSFVFAAGGGSGFTAYSELTEDDQFLIVTEYEGKHYAFAYDGGLTAKEVTVDGDAAIPADDTVIWAAREDNALESIGTPGTFIYAGSYGLMTYTTGRTFVYDAETKHVMMHNLYYLTFDGTAFAQDKDEANAAEITIYRRVMEKAAKAEKYVPDGTPHDPIVRDAVKNDDGSITLAFTSDVHYDVDYEQNNLQVWLENVQKKVGYIDTMGFCGDMGSAYSTSADDYWLNVQGVLDYMDPVVESGAIGTAVYTFGNHEWYPSAGGDYMNNYENPTIQRFIRVGEAVKTDDYIIYCLGSGAIAAKLAQGYSDEDIARIDAYLSTAPTDIPIFVLTHCPSHCWTDRLTAGADKLLDALNKYPNIIVLWGHNHSDFDPAYDAVLHAGDTITIDSKGTERQINFTYLPAGCISDFEYTGVSGGSAWVLGKGVIVTLNADKSITYDYYTMEGDKMAENGPYLVEFREGVDYTTLDLQTVEPGGAAVAPSIPDQLNYTFTGWDTAFDNITRHTVVTAEYEFTTGLDPNYVYFTVQEGSGLAKDQNGEPILLYAIPYQPSLTPVSALKQLETELGYGNPDEIAAGGYGYIAGIGGHTPENGSWVMSPTSGNGYVSATAALTAGNLYYILAYDTMDDYRSTSYLSPFKNDVKVGEQVSFFGESWVFGAGNSYKKYGLNGDVLVGKSVDALVDMGVDAVDGSFKMAFFEPGTYYVAVRSEGNGLAVAKVDVTAFSAVPSPQTITVDGKEVSVTAYNVDGNNYLKLRDVAALVNGTAKQFSVAYNDEERTVYTEKGAAYAALGDELTLSEDLSATAMVSRQRLYVDGMPVHVRAYNVGGYNYLKLRDLGDCFGIDVSYDEATNTVLINTK